MSVEAAPASEILLSVVVPVRDRVGALERVIEALAAQTLGRERFEVIIADDGSTDGLSHRLTIDGEWLRLTRGPACNSYAARNRGAKLARGSVLAFTDADCLPRADWLAAGLKALSDADLVAGHVELVLPRPPTTWAIIDATLFDQERFVAMGKAATANLFMTRAAFEEHGGFDETLPSGGDWEFVERSVRAGARLAFAPEASVQHPTRDNARDFLRRRWRIEHALASRSSRAGLSLWTFNASREAVVRRRWGFAVGYDSGRMAAIGLSSVGRSRVLTAPARYAIIPAVDALAQITGWLRGRVRVAGSAMRVRAWLGSAEAEPSSRSSVEAQR
jgi:glycosyltransferase involved in cell wall biosynthesis